MYLLQPISNVSIDDVNWFTLCLEINEEKCNKDTANSEFGHDNKKQDIWL